MAKEERKMVPSRGGFLNDLTMRIKLVWRLMGDPRVSPLLKLLPLGSILYLIMPLDLAIGPVDDAALLWLGAYLFVELCPPHVVEEHMSALQSVIPGQWRDPLEGEDEVIDAEFREEI